MTFDSRGFKGDSAHPRFLRWMGFLSVVLSIGCIGVGIANTMTRVLAYQSNTSVFTKASVGIWTPLLMFLTGIVTTTVSKVTNSSKRWAGMLSFICCFMLSPVLIGITSIEVMLNKATSQDNSLPAAILVLGVLLFLSMFSIMIVTYFCTFSEDQAPLVRIQETPPPVVTTTVLAPTNTYPNSPAIGYRSMPLVPSGYALPVSQTFGSNLPSAYYNVGGNKYALYGSA